MARSVEVTGRVDEDGKMFLTNVSHIFQWLRSHREKSIRLTIEEYGGKRSSPLNRYYRGVVVPLVMKAMNDFGNEMNQVETHEYLKRKFNYKEVILPNGIVDQVPVSTTKCDNIAFMEYLFRIQKFAAEDLYTIIPDPDPNYETAFFNSP